METLILKNDENRKIHSNAIRGYILKITSLKLHVK